MKLTINLLISTTLSIGLVILYLVASGAEASYKSMYTAEFFLYFGLLVFASYFYWQKIFLLTAFKWIFSDLSFPRGVRWLRWWGALIMLVAAGRAIFWIIGK
jgi:hypothetical protein